MDRSQNLRTTGSAGIERSKASALVGACGRAATWLMFGFVIGVSVSRLDWMQQRFSRTALAHSQSGGVASPTKNHNITSSLGDQPNEAGSKLSASSNLNVTLRPPPIPGEMGAVFLSNLKRRWMGESFQHAVSLQILLDFDEDKAALLRDVALTSPQEEDRLLAMRIVLAVGGPCAARLIKELHYKHNLSLPERMILARAIGLDDGILPRVAPIPGDSELLAAASSRAESADPWDRVLGAGLLALEADENSQVLLTHLAESDHDMRVRAAAIRGLGAIGTPQTLQYLRNYFQLSPHPAAESDIELVEALMISRARLEDRFRSSGR